MRVCVCVCVCVCALYSLRQQRTLNNAASPSTPLRSLNPVNCSRYRRVICFTRMTGGNGNMVLAVMQVSSSHCESQCSSLIGAVQLSGARGWMSNVMFHMESQAGGCMCH